MHKTASTNRFLIDFSLEREFADIGIFVSSSELLERAIISQLVHRANSRHIVERLTTGLIQVAEHSFDVRDNDSLERVSLKLQGLPIKEARIIGQYYQALSIRRSGRIGEALRLLETVADDGLPAYRARALQTLGAINHSQGQIDDALKFYIEARRLASIETLRDFLTTLLVDQEIACIRSEMGDHRGALTDYEKISPLVRIVSREHPLYFYFYHNELAVELAEAGRIAEARSASAIALASPFASAYPEWSETRDEIAAKCKSPSGSVVAIRCPPKIGPAKQPRLDRALKRPRMIPGHPGCRVYHSFQRALFDFPAKAITVLSAVTILKRMLSCTGPRAPPSC